MNITKPARRRTVLLAAAALSAATAAAAQHTTVSQEMGIAVQAELIAPQCYYDFDGKTVSWREAEPSDSHYLSVLVRDGHTSAALPGCDIHAIFTTTREKSIGTSITLYETWDGHQSHYGDNVHLPEDLTSANLLLKISPPKVRRMPHDYGDFFKAPVTVQFTGIAVPPRAAAADQATTEAEKIEWPDGRRPYAEPTPYPGSR